MVKTAMDKRTECRISLLDLDRGFRTQVIHACFRHIWKEILTALIVCILLIIGAHLALEQARDRIAEILQEEVTQKEEEENNG